MNDAHCPILVGVGQVTEKNKDLAGASSPLGLMEQASRLALEDAHLSPSICAQLDDVIVVKSFREPTQNSPLTLAGRLGAEKADPWLMPDGGNGPQFLVNHYFQEINEGRKQFVLLSGAEAMDTGRRIVKSGAQPDWYEKADYDAKYLVEDKILFNEQEQKHSLFIPSFSYAIVENALRAAAGDSIESHQKKLGELFSKFSQVAATVPGAWYQEAKSPQEIAQARSTNRYVGWPYTKSMNAMNQINQSASLLLCSVAFAKENNIPEEKWMYLHGCADTTAERWYFSERENYNTCPAIRKLGEETFKMAEKSIEDIDFFDIYSCFPSAVQLAVNELSIPKDRTLTVTGGLPYHGGAGNNYVMNSIACMVEKLRESRGQYGLVTANGGYLTKHSAGVYSTEPYARDWSRPDPKDYQKDLDAIAVPKLLVEPNGDAVIESYTVSFNRENKPENGIVIGRIGDGGDPMAPRFLSCINGDQELLLNMTQKDYVGAKGKVSPGASNIFKFS